jgi:hypothetical protein
MKKLNLYISEKLHLNKDTEVKNLFDLDDVYILIHKIIVRERLGATPELKVYVENTLSIKEYDEEGNITIVPSNWDKEFKHHYEIINDRIVLCDNIDSWDKCLLLPSEEGIDFLKNLKKNDYCIDLKEYFGEEKKKVIVRNDSMDHPITDEEIENRIKEIKDLL